MPNSFRDRIVDAEETLAHIQRASHSDVATAVAAGMTILIDEVRLFVQSITRTSHGKGIDSDLGALAVVLTKEVRELVEADNPDRWHKWWYESSDSENLPPPEVES